MKKILELGGKFIPSFAKLDNLLEYAEKGYKYMKLSKAFINHFKAFSIEAKQIMGVTETVAKDEPKQKENE